MSSAIGLLLCTFTRFLKTFSLPFLILVSLHSVAQNIDEVEPNNSLVTAQDITPSFSRIHTIDILHSAMLPSVSITATGDDTVDYYKIVVTEADSTYIFDIDYAKDHGGSFDSYIYLLNASGGQITANDDYLITAGGGGSAGSLDSYIKYTFINSGTYILKVQQYGKTYVATGATYTLQVSKESSSFSIDADDDGMSDEWEAFFSITDPAADLDSDGYSNLVEFTQGSNPSFTDSDNDGLVNSEEDDDDNDGVLDVNDAWPLSFAAALDADFDGHPDQWNANCDAQCIEDSGLPGLDQFPQLAGAWLDQDGDGLVDEVNSSCTIDCDIPVEFNDPYPNDFDNDGLSDLIDNDDDGDEILDIDANSNGLVDIDSLEKLNAIRFELTGAGLKLDANAVVNTSGCPLTLYQGTYQHRCHGYELTQDLDFDSNLDGVIDENDLYWNADNEGNGLGWMPIGKNYNQAFSGVFDGNGFEIKNLTINRTSANSIGLFSQIDNATIRNLSLSGSLANVVGNYYVAALVGRAINGNTIINNSTAIRVAGNNGVAGLVGQTANENVFEDNFNTGSIVGNQNVGGLVGALGSRNVIRSSFNTGSVIGSSNTGGLLGYTSVENNIVDSFNSGFVEADNSVGGLIGRVNANNQITSSYSIGLINSSSVSAGLIGYKDSSSTVSQSYWAIDSSTKNSSSGLDEATGYVGLPLDTLKCATVANTSSENSSCVSADGSTENLTAALTLYAGWESSGVWSFGTADQLPSLIINAVNYRDNDADGSFDENDAWPNNAAASLDADGDGYPDAWSLGCDDQCISNSGLPGLDQFPLHAGAWLDADFDGRPDEANADCSQSCELTGLIMDTALSDFDNDELSDAADIDDNNDGVQDVDADSDGLIDIDSLEKLNAMRFELSGIGLKLDGDAGIDSSGCPFTLYRGTYQQRCRGYELTESLNFDVNGDGQLDNNDPYWNENADGLGLGWSPVGNNQASFSTIFEGNGFEIRNLYINRSSEDYVGLFSRINNATIQNLSLTGSLAKIIGRQYVAALTGSSYRSSLFNNSVAITVEAGDAVGGLIGYSSSDSVIEGNYNSGRISGDEFVGGLVGSLYENNNISTSFNTGLVIGRKYVGGIAGRVQDNNTIADSFSSGAIEAETYVGGLVGRLENNNQIHSSYSTGLVKGESSTGGLLGNKFASSIVVQSFWATDSSNQAASSSSSEAAGYVGLPLETLKCAIVANTTSENSSCVSADGSTENLTAAITLYSEWETSAVWNFGTSEQLPGLIVNAVTYRDNDSDGSLDENDAWPNNAAASLDDDEDGHPDAWSFGCDDNCIVNSGLPTLDQFPLHAGAWLDADFDGRPDEVNADCLQNCELTGLVIDTALEDYDNDELSDVADTDDNNDGLPDVDADSDGLIDIDSLEKLNSMRFELSGIGLKLGDDASIDSSGCPFILYQGIYQQRCIGYELTESLDFDANADGVLDNNDPYWNENTDGLGLGWNPVGASTQDAFTATFNGNGHLIKNLFVNRPDSTGIGLFGFANQAKIKNVGLTGRLGVISGKSSVGAITGFAKDTNILGVFNTLPIKANSQSAGLVGNMNSGSLSNSFNSGSVSCIGSQCGGVFGYTQSSMQGNSILTNTYNVGRVTSLNSSASGLVGYKNGTSVQNSYWAVDSSSQSQSSGQNENTGYIGLTSAKMQCAVSADTTSDNSSCVSADGVDENLTAAMTLYSAWGADYWDFGTDKELPALKIGGTAYRDSDGDGFLDADDQFPLLIESSLDNDGDGYPDAWNSTCDEQCILTSELQLDRFPNHAGAWQDDDLDGRPDSINESCTVACDLADLELDTNTALSDADDDGIADAVDDDDNGDGIVDADADSNGLIDIDSLEKLNAMRYQLTGVGLQLSEDAAVDHSGCPVIFYGGAYEQRCSGYELTKDLDFDSNQDDDITAEDLYSNVNELNTVEGWLPIGNQSLPFSAIFNGNDFQIKNLFINRMSTSNLGFFVFLEDANISNVTFSGHLGSVKGYQYVGVLAGRVLENSVLSNIQNKIDVSGDYSTGGIAGRLQSNNSVSLLSNLAKVVSRGNSYAGGLFGYVDSSNSITDSYNAGDVTGIRFVGGLVGYNNNSLTIKGVINTGNVSGSSYVGGLFGRLGNSSNLSSAFNTGAVTGSDSGIGGLVGQSYYVSAISSSFSTGVVTGGTDTGGLVGQYYGNSHRITNSYWAMDASGQANSASEDETDGYVGLTLEALKCAITANTDSANSSCVSADGSAEGLASALILYENWELATYTNELDVEVPYWVFGEADQLPGLNLKGTTYQDSDGDKVLDSLDEFPRISIGALLDTDGDGKPNECDADCVLLGMSADLDDDDDGVLDVDDVTYPLIALSNRTDTDGDGIPNDCGSICRGLGMLADVDDDNDGVLDNADFYSLISLAGATDTDFDGIPDDCDLACSDAGMRADVDDDNDGVLDSSDFYPLIAVGSLDTDGDGIPNNCDQACLDLNMTADIDDDDDGVLDEADGYPLISIGQLTDTDSDGIPDECDQACLDLNMMADNDDDNDGSLDVVDAYPLIAAGSLDSDHDGIPNDCDQTCLDLNMIADTDDDNDGVLDTSDFYPLIAVGSLDTDGDGIPNECDQTCLDLNMVADTDDDDDGVLDGVDGYPLISIGQLTDTDSDGIPNECDQSCIGLGMIADTDDDNDGSLDAYDAYPLIAVGSLDTDADGIPNNCDQACLDLNMVADTDDDNDGSLDGNDAYPLIAAGGLDSDLDGIPNECDQACRNLGMVADTDDDNDGLLDPQDGFPLVAIGQLIDTDNDGRPNVCDQACIDAGMLADTDDDNDGVLDSSDFYPLIAVGSLDTDGDGIPNDCDQVCLDLNMVADSDDDNDGVLDTSDFYPLIAVGGLDTDGDGIPNDCDQTCVDLNMIADADDDNDGLLDLQDGYPLVAIGERSDFDNDGRPDVCNQACMNLGMLADADNDNDGIENDVDAFEFNSAASLDADNDGLPDEWNADCRSNQCQAESGLIRDLLLNDTDNDGATNDIDSDLENDNGKPELLSVAPTMYTPVNTEDGSAFIVSSDLVGQMFAAIRATDAVDDNANLVVKAYLNNEELVRDDKGEVTLPSGLQSISWVVVDTSGNVSEPLEQQVYVYPQVRFKESNSIIGEASSAEIIVELTGDSPEYPVTVELIVSTEQTSIDQEDVGESFDLTEVHTLLINQGDDEATLNRQVSLVVLILEDGESEEEETLAVELSSVTDVSEYFDSFLIDQEHNSHELRVTYQNLTPTVQILIEQDGIEVGNIKQDGGDVTISVLVADGNGLDTHTLVWDLDALNLNAPLGKELKFSPESLPAGDYSLSVSVIDSGINPVEVITELSIGIIAASKPPVDQGPDTPSTPDTPNAPNTPDSSSGGSSGGGGGAMIWLLLIMSGMLLYTRRHYKQ